jgi:hypothetical protein
VCGLLGSRIQRLLIKCRQIKRKMTLGNEFLTAFRKSKGALSLEMFRLNGQPNDAFKF